MAYRAWKLRFSSCLGTWWRLWAAGLAAPREARGWAPGRQAGALEQPGLC